MTRDIGLDVQPPQESCDDPNCPFHGSLSVRGQILEGRVASVKMDKTIVVERRRLWRLPRFERFEKRTSRMSVHRPPCFTVTVGDEVKIAECRPLSKTKSFVLVEAHERRADVRGVDVGAPVIAPDVPEDEDEEEEEDAADTEAGEQGDDEAEQAEQEDQPEEGEQT